MTSPTANSEIRVLVVDDQAHVRGWVRTILERASITQITEASSGHEALGIVTTPGNSFDLVLCDLRMPDGDGIELIRDFGKLAIPTAVAILSVEESRLIETAGLIAEERGLRVLGMIQKPLTGDKLDALLAKLRSGTPKSVATPTVAPTAAELEQALTSRQLEVNYQPRIRMRSGEFMGVEAFVRWNHPTLGQLTADQLVPLIDADARLSHALTDFVAGTAIAAAGRWRASGRELHVSINICANTLDALDLPERLEALCQAQQIPTEWVTLELTEQLVASDSVTLLDIAARLRLKGFRLSVDNVGVGLSGLSQMQRLQRLPFNEVKIDRAFVQGCTESTAKRAVVESTISLAHTLHMTIVAAGVQIRPEWALLDELGCEDAQGYFIARPMSEEGLEAWSLQWMLQRR